MGKSILLNIIFFHLFKKQIFPLIIRLVLFIPTFHQEVASGPFCFLINSFWLLIFVLCVFSLSLSGFNLYCWKGIHFSWSLDFIFLCLFFIFVSNFWYRDLLREFYKKYEILFMVLFLLFFYFFFLKLYYLCLPSGHLFIHYLLQLLVIGLVSIVQILVN